MAAYAPPGFAKLVLFGRGIPRDVNSSRRTYEGYAEFRIEQTEPLAFPLPHRLIGRGWRPLFDNALPPLATSTRMGARADEVFKSVWPADSTVAISLGVVGLHLSSLLMPPATGAAIGPNPSGVVRTWGIGRIPSIY